MRDAHISIAGRSNRFRVERCSRDRCDPGLTPLTTHSTWSASTDSGYKLNECISISRRLERVWVDSADLLHYHMHLRTTSDSSARSDIAAILDRKNGGLRMIAMAGRSGAMSSCRTTCISFVVQS